MEWQKNKFTGFDCSMRINPVSFSNYNRVSVSPGVRKVQSFTSHPDYERINQNYNIKTSYYFRRGQEYENSTDLYCDIEKVLKDVFAKTSEPKKILIAGIGDSQEPFSYLATIKDLGCSKPLSEIVDLYTVDLQSKPNWDKLVKDSYYDSYYPAKYAADSFIFDPTNYGQNWDRDFRVSNDILSLVNESYNNPAKSMWDTPIQEAAKLYGENTFDVVSANNVLYYIGDKKVILETVKDIVRCIKPGGYFITDPKCKYFKYLSIPYKIDEISEGIYQKL